MDTNLTGSIKGTRHGSVIVSQSAPFTITDGTAKKIFTIKASTTIPVVAEFFMATVTAFNAGTTNKFSVGTTSAATEIINVTNPPAAAAASASTTKVLTADTDIYVQYTQSGTAATTGAGAIVAKIYTLNLTATNTVN